MTAVRNEPFGRLPNGRIVESYELTNSRGTVVTILAFGGILQSYRVARRNGGAVDIVLGYDTLEPYLADPYYFGALIGRYAGRITRGELALDGRTYALDRNEGRNTLHGGAAGFSKALWSIVESGPDARLVLLHRSPDGDQGFPGTVEVRATYRLLDDDALTIAFAATAATPTTINLTSHAYWRLAGDTILDHELWTDAGHVLEIDAEFLPTGAILPAEATPFDFRVSSPLGTVVRADHPQIARVGGLDHCFVVRGWDGKLRHVATLAHPPSARSLTIETNEPGLQVYTSNRMSTKGKGGECYGRWAGVALEAQHFPDSPHHSGFPPTVLRPGETLQSLTRFRPAIP